MVLAATLKRRTTRELPGTVVRATAVLPASVQEALFTIAGGLVKVTDFIGEVTVAMDATTTTLTLVANPTVGADINVATASGDIASDTAGQLYSVGGNVGGAWNIDGTATEGMIVTGLVFNTGTIDLLTSATNTGSVRWIIKWVPIDIGASLVAA